LKTPLRTLSFILAEKERLLKILKKGNIKKIKRPKLKKSTSGSVGGIVKVPSVVKPKISKKELDAPQDLGMELSNFLSRAKKEMRGYYDQAPFFAKKSAKA